MEVDRRAGTAVVVGIVSVTDVEGRLLDTTVRHRSDPGRGVDRSGLPEDEENDPDRDQFGGGPETTIDG